MALNNITAQLKEKKRFLLLTHKDPDVDGIGSMLALGKALINAGKEVVLFSSDHLHSPINILKGADRIINEVESQTKFETIIALDCGDKDRIGVPHNILNESTLLINIDHHESHDLFGDLNLVDSRSSSTGELVYRVIKHSGFPIDPDMAENIFAAIQADTGAFRYDNTTADCFRIAAEMMECGVKPYQIYQEMTDKCSPARLKLLELALGAVEFHHEGQIGMAMLSSEMFKKAQARSEDSEKFVDYLRYVSGVELAVLVRQTSENMYKFSIRSNDRVNVAKLASLFGGGGHAKAAGFECHSSIETLKSHFLKEAGKFLSGIYN